MGSILDGISDVKKIPKRCKELGIKTISISDHGSCASHYKMQKICRSLGLNYSIGNEFYISFDPCPLKINRGYSHFVIFAGNNEGIKDLWQASNYANNQENFYYKPRLNIKNWTDPTTNKMCLGLEHFANKGNLIGISGHIGSLLADAAICDFSWSHKKREEAINSGYKYYKEAKDIDFYRKFLLSNWLENTSKLAIELHDIFKGNFYIELQDIYNPQDQRPMIMSKLICECLREVSRKTGIKAINSDDPHYIKKEDAKLQRSVLAITLKQTEESIKEQIESEKDCFAFWGSDEFYIKDFKTIAERYTPEEIKNGNDLGDSIKLDDLTRQPVFPSFNVPEFPILPQIKNIKRKEDQYLMYLVIEGAKKIQPWLTTKYSKKDYWDRVKFEFNIIETYGLSTYFLMVQDFCKAADFRPSDHNNFDWQTNLINKGEVNPIARGWGRGSGGSSIICRFLDITQVDPLEHNLIFSRFLNAGRFTKGNVSCADLDIDVQPEGREWVINYLKYKYGKEKVSHIASYNLIKGRSAIKDQFRIKGIKNGYEIANEICGFIPPESLISGELQEARSAGDEDYGVIEWSLENVPELAPYYEKYKEIFDQAKEMENIPRSRGKHPSGILVSSEVIEENFPMCWDTRSKEKMVEFEYHDAESCGGIKVDILGLSCISKLALCQGLINDTIS